MRNRHKSPLSEQDKAALAELRHRLLTAVIIRSSKDPSEFATNLWFLKEQEALVTDWMQLFSVHMETQLNAMERASEHVNLFTLFKLKRIAKKEAAIVNDIQTGLFTPELREAYAREFIKEPRITALNVHKNHNEQTNRDRFGRVMNQVTDRLDCTITFSDHTVLTFHSLTDPDVLADVERQFNDKMKELSRDNRLAV